jgi:hypothetical protein
MPALAFSQQKKQQRVCVPSRTQVINCCCDSPKVVVNVAPSSQLVLEPDLKQAIIEKLKEKKKSDFWETILKWLAAVSPVFLAWLAYRFARRQSRFDNLLKADIEWIRDFRAIASQVMADLHSLILLIDVVDSKDALMQQAGTFHQQQNTVQSKKEFDKARNEYQVSVNDLLNRYSLSLKPLMELKLSLTNQQDHKTLMYQIDYLYEEMSNQKILNQDKVEVVIENIRTVMARHRIEIERRA